MVTAEGDAEILVWEMGSEGRAPGWFGGLRGRGGAGSFRSYAGNPDQALTDLAR